MTTPEPRRQKSAWRTMVPVLFILVSVIGGLLFLQTRVAHRPRSNAAPEVQIQQTVPPFTLTRLDGTTSELSEVRGKVFLVNFWATWCEACMSEMPSIVRLREKYKSQGF